MTLISDCKVPLVVVDDIQKELDRFYSFSNGTTQSKETYESIMLLLQAEKYIFFKSDFRTYALQTKCEAAIYKVPQNVRGNLKPYASKTVRVICIGYSERWPQYAQRRFAAGLVKPGTILEPGTIKCL